MGVTLTDVLLFGKAQSDDVDKATFVIYRRNILRWSALGGYLDIIVKGVSPLSLPDAIANSLEYVKAFGGTEQRNLPDGYIERQFIYMMDGSYLLTDIVPAYDGRVEMDFQTTSIPSSNFVVLGGRTGTTAGNGLQFISISSSFNVDSFGERYDTTVAPIANTRYKFTFDNKVCTLVSGNSTLFSHTSSGADATGGALAINARNSDGTIGGNTAGIYLYSFKVWNGQGELVMDLVPAVQRGTVPVVGFYDTVSGTFKTATAGTFAAGGEAVPTPDTPMDIISNNGVLKYGVLGKNLFDDELLLNATGWTKTDGIYSGNNGTLYAKYGTSTDGFPLQYKANTQYTLSYTIVTSGSVNNARFRIYYTDNTYDDGPLSGIVTTPTTYTVTSASGKSISKIVYNYTNGSGNISLKDIQLEQGTTATPYEPYRVGIYTDGTVETINVHNKNLFDYEYFYDNYQNYGTSAVGRCLIQLKPNTAYTISTNKNSSLGNSVMFVVSGSAIDWTPSTTGNGILAESPRTVTTDSNGYLCFGLYVEGENAIPESDFVNGTVWVQIEKGSTATTYESYYNGGTSVAEMLLKIDDYEDVQEILSGAVTRNVGVKVLNGTENWATGAAGRYYLNITPAYVKAQYTPLCSHFQMYIESGGTGDMTTPDTLALYTGSVGVYQIYAYPSTATANSLSAWKAFLADQYNAGTPVIIVYPLATPTTESVAGQTLQVQAGDNTLEITQASIDNLELEAKYQAAVSLTIQEVQDANLDPNVQVTIN